MRRRIFALLSRANCAKLPAVNFRMLLAILAIGPAGLLSCGGDDDRPATFSYIAPAILGPNCATASCHSPSAAVAGLDLSTVESSFKGLRGQKLAKLGDPMVKDDPGRDGARPMVSPFNPDQSRLVNMLRARGAKRMPPNRPLAEADIEIIERWILGGAENN